MKTVLAVAALLSLLAISVVHAETKADRGREVINIKMGWMILPFKHWEHQKRVKNDCAQCHTGKVGVIQGWGPSTAHDLCIPCHEAEEKGPSECRQCHKR
ncbi:MAG TPA: hypothetical protein VJ550_04125 [Geomonas sp.]|nr:hypothetical protein [Geomonas sp.]